MVRTIKASKETLNRKFTAVPSNPSYKRSFSPMEVVQLLQEIDELKGLHITFQRVSDGSIEFTVGDNVYETRNFEETE